MPDIEVTRKNGAPVKVACAHDDLVPLEKIIENPRNPNKHPKKQIELLAKIIEARGWRHPITVSNQSGFIVAGAGRLMAAKALDLDAAPVDYQDYVNEAEEWADLLADNRIPEFAETDKKLLSELLSELKAQSVDLALAGFDIKTADKLFEQIARSSNKGGASAILRAASLESLKPTDEEYAILKDRKFLVEFSGGKDSSAATAWLKTFFPDNQVELMFVDLGADFIGFHIFLHQFAEHVGYELKVLRAEKTVFDAFLAKGDWPMFIGPYCHEYLHKPLDDNVMRHDADKVCVVRGGRMAEKAAHGKTHESRFRTIDRMEKYLFFEPLYFGAKEVSESVLKETGVPVWEGYSFGLQRTACRICPGQKPKGYAAIRAQYPDVWAEILFLEERFGPGSWQRREDGFARPVSEMADLGQADFEAGGYPKRNA
jgi:3'-phosphoadenosine 5'-phosphosulfate sulfotransferase (PAPS reductase)/FAD synthetase